jgi:hypothetical protein
LLSAAYVIRETEIAEAVKGNTNQAVNGKIPKLLA